MVPDWHHQIICSTSHYRSSSPKRARPRRPRAGRGPCPACSGIGYLPSQLTRDFVEDLAAELEAALGVLRELVELYYVHDQGEAGGSMSAGAHLELCLRSEAILRGTISPRSPPEGYTSNRDNADTCVGGNAKHFTEGRTVAQRRFARSDDSTAEEMDSRRKVGFLISAENDFKLTVFARKKKTDRSKLVNEAITEMCRGVVISFRGKASEEGEAA